MDRIFQYIQQFSGLPFLVRRAVLCVFFLGCFVFGVKIGPVSEQLGKVSLLVAFLGLIWATGFWMVLWALLVVAAWVLRIFY